MRFYLAGPMSGLPDFNYPAFHRAEVALRELGFNVVSPARVSPDAYKETPSPALWLRCMKDALRALLDCDGIILLPGWEESRGASLEAGLASDLGYEILNYTDLVEEV